MKRLEAGFQPHLQFRQVFRTGLVNGADGMEGAPVTLAVAEASQVAVRIALFQLLAPENISKGQS